MVLEYHIRITNPVYSHLILRIAQYLACRSHSINNRQNAYAYRRQAEYLDAAKTPSSSIFPLKEQQGVLKYIRKLIQLFI